MFTISFILRMPQKIKTIWPGRCVHKKLLFFFCIQLFDDFCTIAHILPKGIPIENRLFLRLLQVSIFNISTRLIIFTN